jgi:hypothetical protein
MERSETAGSDQVTIKVLGELESPEFLRLIAMRSMTVSGLLIGSWMITGMGRTDLSFRAKSSCPPGRAMTWLACVA